MAEALEAHLAHLRDSGRPTPDPDTDAGRVVASLDSFASDVAALVCLPARESAIASNSRTGSAAESKRQRNQNQSQVPSTVHHTGR